MAIDFADVAAVIEDEYKDTFLNFATESSTALRAFTTVPMGSRTASMPVLASLPEAKWVGTSAEDRTKPVSGFSFENKMLNAAEVAVIIKINDEDIEDSLIDLAASTVKLGAQAIAKKVDQAVFFGIDKPELWTSNDLFTAATAAGATFQVGDGTNDLVGSIFQAADALDSSGANPESFVGRNGLKYKLANLRDGQGSPIYLPSLSASAGSVDNVGGLDAYWNKNGAWDSAKALGMVVDPSLVVLGIRTDLQVKYLDQIYAETDQVAFRFRARYAYALADGISMDGKKASPVAAVVPAGEAEA